MPSGNFARQIEVAVQGLQPEAISKLLAQVAKTSLRDAQAAGEFPLKYLTTVNGQFGRTEESVTPPGPIVYTAIWWPEIVTYAISFAVARSPVKSGRYRRSWIALSNGSLVTDVSAIPLDAEVIITNPQPYARKIEVGHMKMSVPPGVVEDVVAALRRKFGTLITVRRMFIPLSGELTSGASLPYRLHGGGRRRRDGSARELTYPSAVIQLRL